MTTTADLVRAALNGQPAHAGTIRNRILDATRGTSGFDAAMKLTAEAIDSIAASIGATRTLVRCPYCTGRYKGVRMVAGWHRA